MTKKIIALLPILILATLIGCTSTKKNTTTYFGGKIINPKSNQVILYTMEKVIDTFFLDENHKFMGKIENANEGLYYFTHGNENQYAYIEPEDSLMIRLNTWDFDESLVFAGKGAERNNILIDCFLESENERKLFYQFNKLPPEEFKDKADSLLALKMNTYDDYLDSHKEETNGYKKILKIALTFPVFERLERYPYINAKYSENQNFPKLQPSFYNFRKNITINKDSLMYFPPYSKYIRNYLYNETYTLGHPPMKTKYSSKFTIDLLNTIDKNITLDRTKNAILRQTIINHFYNNSSCNINKDVFDTFLKLSTNTKDKDLVESLISDAKTVSANKNLPNFEVTNYSDTDHKIFDVIKNNNTFLFFWNPNYVSHSYVVSRMNYLSSNYPDIKFIQVKIDGDHNDRIQRLDIKSQFYLKNTSDAHQFLSSKMPRAILVNKQGKVVNGYASISSRNLNSYLKQLNKN